MNNYQFLTKMHGLIDEKERLAIFYKIRGAAITVEQNLGPFLIEKYYELAFAQELKALGFDVKQQVAIPTFYKGNPLGLELVADLIIDDDIIIELKATKKMETSYVRQLLSYMRLMRIHHGLIINFGISYISRYGIKPFILTDFDTNMNVKTDFNDKFGVDVFINE